MKVQVFREKTNLRIGEAFFEYDFAFKNKLNKYKFLTKNEIAEKISIKNNVDVEYVIQNFKDELEHLYKKNTKKVLYKRIVNDILFRINWSGENWDLKEEGVKFIKYDKKFIDGEYFDFEKIQTLKINGEKYVSNFDDNIEKFDDNIPTTNINYNKDFFDYKNKQIYYYPSSEIKIKELINTVNGYRFQEDRYNNEGWGKPKYIQDIENNLEKLKLEEIELEKMMLSIGKVDIEVYDERFKIDRWVLNFKKLDKKEFERYELIEKNNQPYYKQFFDKMYIGDLIKKDKYYADWFAQEYKKNNKIWNDILDKKTKKPILFHSTDLFKNKCKKLNLDFSYKL